jgi:hypothetical protein
MASPDVTPYVDLTLFDASSQQIFLDAIDYAKVALPEFAPQDGSIETVLLQTMALETQEAIYAINRLPGAVVEVLLRLLDIERNSGTAATCVVKFIGSTTANFTVPLGTRLYYQESFSSDVLLLETTEQITATQAKIVSLITQSSTTITVTTSTRHGLSSGNLVSISGTVAMNISNAAITVIGPSQFTVTAAGPGTYSETAGTVTPALTIPATGFAAVRTSTITEDFNGLPSGTELVLLSIIPEVASLATASVLLGGVVQETDTEYFSRAVATLSRLSTALVTTTQMDQFVVESGRYQDAYRVHSVDNTDETRRGNLANNVMIAVAPVDATVENLLNGIGDGSVGPASVDYGIKDVIYEGVVERVHSALDPVVVNPAIVEIGITATVKLPSGIISATVQDACNETLSTYISPNTWDWSDTVRYNEVITQLRNTTVDVGTVTLPAVEYVSSVQITPSDAYISEQSTLYEVTNFARAGTTCTLTINGPGVAGAHGLNLAAGETLWVKVVDVSNTAFNTTNVVQVLTTPSDTTITYTQGTGTITSAATATGCILPIKRDASGNLTIFDPAPLITSGTHSTATV